MRLFSIFFFSLKLTKSRRLAESLTTYGSVIGAVASMYGMLCASTTVQYLQRGRLTP